MFKNRKFAKYTIAFLILGVLFNFMYSGLQNDQINIIQAFSAWNNASTVLPLTVGNIVAIPLTFVYGTLFIRFGVRKTLIPCILICALGCVGIAAAGGLSVTSGVNVASATTASGVGSYWLYFISLFIVRCTCMCFQMSGFQLAASWFIRYRGTVLGVITLGSPLFSVVGTSVMSTMIQTRMGSDYRPFYIGVAVLIVIIAVFSGLFLRDFPEDVNLFPDGSKTRPKSEENESVDLSVKSIVTRKKTWIMVCNFGAYMFIINACMASMAAWFINLCVSNLDMVAAGSMAGAMSTLGVTTLWLGQAVKWLSVGAILGIPMSFLFGVIDDHFGTPLASLLLGITCIVPPAALAAQASVVEKNGACSVPLLILWGFGVACMTGGVPTLDPASVAFAFGRREYQAALRIILALQMVPTAFAAVLMSRLIDKGLGFQAYIGIICVAIFGILFTIPMFKMKDANAADRIYGEK